MNTLVEPGCKLAFSSCLLRPAKLIASGHKLAEPNTTGKPVTWRPGDAYYLITTISCPSGRPGEAYYLITTISESSPSGRPHHFNPEHISPLSSSWVFSRLSGSGAQTKKCL